MKKQRYRLHWANGAAPKPNLQKWVIYDWKIVAPVAYSETRAGGRRLCDFLNAEWRQQNAPRN